MTSANRSPASTGVISIDLGQLVRNWQALRDLVRPALCAAVVKADAYGLGAARVIPALASAGCAHFFIATPAEAEEARRLAPMAEIYGLDGLIVGGGEDLISTTTHPVLSSLAEVQEWGDIAGRRQARLACALQIDTGLNRLGLSAREVQDLARNSALLGRLDIRLIMSHLACADDPLDPKNEQQRAIFEQLRGILPKAPASLAASDGLMLGAPYHFDLVRPGYALYGGQAFQGGATPVHPVVTAEARILQIRDVAPGQAVGYSATFKATRLSRIATISAGYADGYFRAASAPSGASGGVVGIGGRLAPIVGRVSMDLITIDVTDFNDPPPKRGDLVELIGPNVPIEAFGQRAGTIGYEVLTNLGRRFQRSYLEG